MSLYETIHHFILLLFISLLNHNGLTAGDTCDLTDHYQCKANDNNQAVCIPKSFVGDYVLDCPLGDDERGFGFCDFEPGRPGLLPAVDQMCGWSLSSSEVFQLKQHTSAPGSFDPLTDGPPSFNASGWFMYTKTKRFFKDEPFTFSSPSLPPMSSRCSFSFAFYANGPVTDEEYSIIVQMIDLNTSQSILVAPLSVKTSQKWQTISVSLPIVPSSSWSNLTLTIVPVTSNSNEAIVAFDNFRFSESCSKTRGLPDVDCDFDDFNTCQWTQNRPAFQKQLLWLFGDGSQVETLNGPGVPYNGTGYYMFVSNRLITGGSWMMSYYGQLVSNIYDRSTEPMCLQFAYSVFGPKPGSFRVYVFLPDLGPVRYKEIFSREVSQGNQWRRGYATIAPVDQRYYLMFYAFTALDRDGYIAIDNIRIKRGECPTLPMCDFENNMCGWKSAIGDDDPYDFIWRRINPSGSQSGHKFGPPQDHTTESKDGYFMSFEASYQQIGDRASLKSPPYPVPDMYLGAKCFQFWYNMNGEDVGTLSVSVVPTRNRRTIFLRSGNHGNHWWQGKLAIRTSDFSAIDRTGNFTLLIEGIRGASDDSDMAVDDVEMRDGLCSSEATCDFENDQCSFSNVYELNDLSWIRNNNRTPSAYSGPSVDHTKGTSAGYYMFVNSLDANTVNSMAYYASEIIQGSSDGHCFSFWYQMFGPDVGILSVLLLDPKANWSQSLDSASTTLWHQSGAKYSSQWFQARFNVVTPKEYSLVFAVNFTKIGGNGDIAIDDIVLDKSGPCYWFPKSTTTPSPKMYYPCGFETTDCGYTASNSDSDISQSVLWQRSTGSSPVAKQAPEFDHTRNDQMGFYLASFVNASSSYYYIRFFSSYALSPFFTTPRRHCTVSFYYYLSSDFAKIQTIGAGIRPFGSDEKSEILLWTLDGYNAQRKGEWIEVIMDLGQQKASYQIFFKHTFKSISSSPGLMAFDDISYMDCTSPPPQPYCTAPFEFQCKNDKACVQTSRLCDGTEDCGDGTDEAPEQCSQRVVITFEFMFDYNKYYTLSTPGDSDNVDFSWKWQTASRSYYETGPRFDHTFGNWSGWFYCARSPNIPYQKAWLKLAPISANTSTNCHVRFYYHMYGRDIGTLTVYYRTEIGGPLVNIWSKSGEVGDFWLRGDVEVSSANGDNIEVIFEALTTGTYSPINKNGDIALDDISLSEGCVMISGGKLPTAITTEQPTSAIPACDKDPNMFSCGEGQDCIERDRVCNFVWDCDDGRDEMPPFCVRNPSTFAGPTLADDGWSTRQTNAYTWARVNASASIPQTCRGACPEQDADGDACYAMADSWLSKTGVDKAILTVSKPFLSSAPQCQIRFAYIVNTIKNLMSGSLELYVTSLNTTTRNRIWSASAGTREWRFITANIGLQTSPFTIEFSAEPAREVFLPAVAAVDFVSFTNCDQLEPKDKCDQNLEFRCEPAGTCIQKTYICDFADNCGDGPLSDGSISSDERNSYCKSVYIARCAFDEPASSCDDWFFDKGDASWRVVQVKNAGNPGYPARDHTLGTSDGHILLLQYFPSEANGHRAKFTSRRRYVVTRETEKCTIRFWLYQFGMGFPGSNDIGYVQVIVRTSYSPLKEYYLSNYTYLMGDLWVRQEIPVPTVVLGINVPFEITFIGVTGISYSSNGVAIDDISLTPECHVTDQLLPGQQPPGSTTQHAPSCTDTPGMYRCADGNGCYSIAQHCNFMYDCQDGSDEFKCTKNYCDFDGGNYGNRTDWCGWSDVCSGADGNCPDASIQWMWTWWNKPNMPENKAAPPNDYTSNFTGGGFLMSSGGHMQNDRSILQSSEFQDASPECTLKFAYYAYTYPYNMAPSKLNVYVKSASTGRKRVLEVVSGNSPTWNVTSVNVYSKQKFEVQFEVVRGGGSYGDISLDAIEFYNCTPTIPATKCPNPTDFLCKDASRCIEEAELCDYTPDCRDGSDEDEAFCATKRARGSCTFENADNWQAACSLRGNVTGEDLISWNVQQVSKITRGPSVDHTLSSRQGHVAWVDTSKEDFTILETATLATTSTFPANPSGSCHIRLYYYLYRAKTSRGSGRLKVMTVNEVGGLPVELARYSLVSIAPGTSTEELYGKAWQAAKLRAIRSEPFRIQIQAELDDSANSVFAVDDISLSDGCRTGSGESTGNATKCRPDELFCESEMTCLAPDWICDGWCDCPATMPGQQCIDEADERCLIFTTQHPVDSTTAKQPVTSQVPTVEPISSETTASQTTTNTTGNTDNNDGDLSIILGASFGSFGFVVLVGVGIFLLYRFRHPTPTETMSGGIANPVYGNTALREADDDPSNNVVPAINSNENSVGTTEEPAPATNDAPVVTAE